MDGEASSPARCRASNLRFEPSAVSPRAKPENPKGFQPPCHPHQFLLKSKRFPGAKTARKRFLLWKMRFTKTAPCPPYTPLARLKVREGCDPLELSGGFSTVWPPLKGEVPAKQAVEFESRRIRRLQFMADEFVSEPAAGSGCRPSRPAASGSRLSLPEPPPARPSRQRRQVFSGSSRKTAEFGEFNLCFPNSCAIRRQQVAVGPADPAAASVFRESSRGAFFKKAASRTFLYGSSGSMWIRRSMRESTNGR